MRLWREPCGTQSLKSVDISGTLSNYWHTREPREWGPATQSILYVENATIKVLQIGRNWPYGKETIRMTTYRR